MTKFSKYWGIGVFFIFALVALSCKSINEREKPSSCFGKYCTLKLPLIKTLTLQIQKKKSYKVGTIAVMLYLRSDSTFVWGSCDYQITLSGNFSINNDSIILYNIYNHKAKKEQANKTFFFNPEKNIVNFESKLPPSFKEKYNLKYSDVITTLARNSFDVHFGVLRNENMPLDSLLKYNSVWEHDKQMDWLHDTKEYIDIMQKKNH